LPSTTVVLISSTFGNSSSPAKGFRKTSSSFSAIAASEEGVLNARQRLKSKSIYYASRNLSATRSAERLLLQEESVQTDATNKRSIERFLFI
jgi:hypothetical protein